MSYKRLFSKALAAAPERLHFAAHSHHLWPDVTEDAQAQYWRDSATLADHKWDKIFSDIIPANQRYIAAHLKLSDPATIAFAPNTHELLNRILSCLPAQAKILTTDSEFYSFTRQIARLEEDGRVQVTRVSTRPFASFPDRFRQAMAESYDLVFFSHVFFNSGYALPDLKSIVDAMTREETFIVIDGYHGFMALPTDLSGIENRAFYLAGGYKYAMSGEGCCFLHCPPGYGPRPRNTGWFADMGALAHMDESGVAYATDGFRFWGATFDPSGLYRMNAVMRMLETENISVEQIHSHVLQLQDEFSTCLKAAIGELVTPVDTPRRGHFLTYQTDKAADLCKALAQSGVITDHRGSKLRFGFALYHDRSDIDQLLGKIEAL